MFITEAHVGGGNGFNNNVINNFDSGTDSASTSGSGSVSGAAISGSAEAAASFLQLGAQASTSLTNANNVGAIRASATAIMQDTITITSPNVANGSRGFLQYVFSAEGTLNVTNTSDTQVRASAVFTITHDFGTLGGWQWIRTQMAAGTQTVNEAVILSDLIPFVYGTPFGLRFIVQISGGIVNPASQNFTTASDFLNTLTVTDFSVFDENEVAVALSSVTGDGGTVYPGSTVPEPRALLLLALAGAALHRALRRP